MIYAQTRYLPAGDRALSIEFGDEISPLLAERVRAMVSALDAEPLPGVLGVLPTYRSVMVLYDPDAAGGYCTLLERLMRVEHRLSHAELPEPRVIELPVLYGGEAGPDLAAVAAHCSLSPREVVRLHSEREYLVYMLGFTPGFPYLGGLNPALATPRLKEPRVKIPAGSVGIAGTQTGVYPIDSPGGWQLIGKTPLRLFDLARPEPFLLAPGDRLRFRPIDAQEYAALAGAPTMLPEVNDHGRP